MEKHTSFDSQCELFSFHILIVNTVEWVTHSLDTQNIHLTHKNMNNSKSMSGKGKNIPKGVVINSDNIVKLELCLIIDAAKSSLWFTCQFVPYSLSPQKFLNFAVGMDPVFVFVGDNHSSTLTSETRSTRRVGNTLTSFAEGDPAWLL